MRRVRKWYERREHSLCARLWDAGIIATRQQAQQDRRNQLSKTAKRTMWRRWHRERQILGLLPMVERIASNVKWMFANHLDPRDLAQAGAIGLVNAANTYDVSRGDFERYAYFRVRGAIIDSQKRKVYREECNVSLQAIAEVRQGWLPPELDTDGKPLPDEQAVTEEARRRLYAAIDALPPDECAAMRGYLDGKTLGQMAKALKRSTNAVRDSLELGRKMVESRLRGYDDYDDEY